MHEPIPAHVVHCRSLTLELCETKKIKETKEKMISLIKLSDPISLTLKLLWGHMLLAECLSAISKMENFTRLELDFFSERVFQIDESFAKKLKVLHFSGGELVSIDRLTSLVELNMDEVKVSDKEIQNISSLSQLKILRLGFVNSHVEYDEYGDIFSFFSSGLLGLE